MNHLALSDSNYTAAWKLLQDRYNNPRLLVLAFFNKILGQPSQSSDKISTVTLQISAWYHTRVSSWSEKSRCFGRHLESSISAYRVEVAIAGTVPTSPKNSFTVVGSAGYLEYQGRGRQEKITKDTGVSHYRGASTRCVQWLSALVILSTTDRFQHLPKLWINVQKGGHYASSCSLKGSTKGSSKHRKLVPGRVHRQIARRRDLKQKKNSPTRKPVKTDPSRG